VLLKLAKDVQGNVADYEVSQQRLAEALGCHRITVNKALKSLEDRGLLESTDPDGRPKTYALRFLDDSPAPPSLNNDVIQREWAPPPSEEEHTVGALLRLLDRLQGL